MLERISLLQIVMIKKDIANACAKKTRIFEKTHLLIKRNAMDCFTVISCKLLKNKCLRQKPCSLSHAFTTNDVTMRFKRLL